MSDSPSTFQGMPSYISSKLCSLSNELPERYKRRVYDSDICSLLVMRHGNILIQDDTESFHDLHKDSWYIQRGGFYQIKEWTENYCFCCFTFKIATPDNIHQLFPQDGRLGGYNVRQQDQINEMLTLTNTHSYSSFLRQNAILYTVLANIYECHQNRNHSESLPEKLTDYVEAHFQEDITLQHLANTFNYSGEYIAKCFRKKHGISIHRFQNELRIRLAKELIVSRNNSLIEIASLCGYNEYSTFYRSFMEITSISPQAFLEISEHTAVRNE